MDGVLNCPAEKRSKKNADSDKGKDADEVEDADEDAGSEFQNVLSMSLSKRNYS